MRIDIDSFSFRPDYTPQKTSGDANELNNRGENVRGRVVDVNSNIVLIQTSTGKQFSATTVVPMENYLDQDVSFSIMVGPDGELILTPEIDDDKRLQQQELKLQDVLAKLGKSINAENKDIIKNMMKSSIPITKENFEQVKELKFAMNLLQSEDFAVSIGPEDLEQNIGDIIKDIQNKKDFGIAQKQENTILSKDVALKDLLLLKNLDMKVSPKNISALTDMLSKINDANVKGDITGMKELIAGKNFAQDIKLNLQNMKMSIVGDVTKSEVDSYFDDLHVLLENADSFSASDMEKLNKGFGNMVFKDFSEEMELADKNTDKLGVHDKNIDLENIESDDIIEMLKDLEKNVNKKLSKQSENRREELKIDYETVKDDIKTVISMLGKESETSKTLEKQIAPKLDILSNMLEKYNYNVIPFRIEQNQENTLQYYVKKDKKNLKKQDEINIGLSLDTNNFGNVKAMVNYNKNNSIKLDFSIQNKNVKALFDNHSKELNNIMKTLGFNNVDIKVNVKKENMTLIEDAIYNPDANKSFEFYI